MDPRVRFTSTVDDYRRHRPDYPDALLDWICADAALEPGSMVLDVGCGTGISTRALATRGLSMIGLDPNEAMLAAARSEDATSKIEWVLGDGETLPIDARHVGKVDAIVGGQSFHWLDLDRALPRFAEALRPGGRAIAFWNLRDDRDALMRDYEALLVERCPEYVRVGAEPRANAILEREGLANVTRASFEGIPQLLDRTAFRGRVWSSSYVRASIGAAARPGFEAALDALFDAHSKLGRVRFVYRTVAIGWTPGG